MADASGYTLIDAVFNYSLFNYRKPLDLTCGQIDTIETDNLFDFALDSLTYILGTCPVLVLITLKN